jgi:ribonuclease P protein component
MKTTLSLKKNYEFRRLYTRGKNYASHLVVIYCGKNRRAENRLGITVGAKVEKPSCGTVSAAESVKFIV